MTLDEMLEIIRLMPGRPPVAPTPEQRAILNVVDGPLWVIAGPGSGKTETLSLRCLRLIYVDRVDPRGIIVTTFTEKAARELQDRITAYASWISSNADPTEVADIDVTHVRIGTLHAVCNDVLQEFRYPAYQNVRLMDELEQLIFINEHSELVAVQPTQGSPEAAIWTTFSGLLGGWQTVSPAQRMRNRLLRALGARNILGRIAEYRVDLDRMAAAGGMWPRLARGYGDYVEKLRVMRRSDFSQVQATFLQFLGEPKGRQFLEGTADQPGIAYVLVDEYQDTNPIQAAIYFELTRMEPHNLMVVGDDDQAIYRFRGGTVESLIEFNTACAGAWGVDPDSVRPLPLYDNFRSQSHIVDWCNRYVTAFPEMQLAGSRAPGKLMLQACSMINSDLPDYASVNLLTGPQPRDIARVFALCVRQLLDDGIVQDPSDVALLMPSTRETRTWAQPYVDALAAQGISAFNPRAKKFLDQEEVQASLGALMAILDPDLKACPNNQALRRMAQEWDQAYQAAATASPLLARYVADARGQVASKPPVERLNVGAMELFYILLSFEPFVGWQRDIERSLRLAKVTRILEAYTATPYEDAPERTRAWLFTSQDGGNVSWRWRTSFYWGLASILQQEGLDDEEDEYVPFPRGRLPIMTIFQAKGLQFPFVFVATKPGDDARPSGTHEAEDLLLPFRVDAPAQRFSAAERAIQDAVRLYYVAHSRAQYGLTILATHDQRDNDGPQLGPNGAAWVLANRGQDLTLLPVVRSP